MVEKQPNMKKGSEAVWQTIGLGLMMVGVMVLIADMICGVFGEYGMAVALGVEAMGTIVFWSNRRRNN